MALEVVGTGMIARAFASQSANLAEAIVCAAGVADSQCIDPAAFQRERELLVRLARRAVARNALLVYFSGAPVYGPLGGPHTEIGPLAPQTPYGRHKVECEELIVASGAAHLVLRLPNVVGPVGHPNQLVPSLIAQIATGHVVVRAGATRDLLDVHDLVRIVGALVRKRTTNTILNVASGISTPVGQLADQIAAILDVSPTVAIVDGGDRQEFSTVRIRSLLPDYPPFGPHYPAAVLTRHVPSIHGALTAAAIR
jgi:nucleoside-diphosphate-sugar epimerase